MAIQEAREQVATALAPLGIPVHRYSTGAVVPPCAVLVWGSPLYDPKTATRVLVGIDIRLVVSSASGSPAQAALDALVDAAIPALMQAGIFVDSVQTPTPDPDTATLTAVVATFVSVDLPRAAPAISR